MYMNGKKNDNTKDTVGKIKLSKIKKIKNAK